MSHEQFALPGTRSDLLMTSGMPTSLGAPAVVSHGLCVTAAFSFSFRNAGGSNPVAAEPRFRSLREMGGHINKESRELKNVASTPQ
jgi:hypothetical protein